MKSPPFLKLVVWFTDKDWEQPSHFSGGWWGARLYRSQRKSQNSIAGIDVPVTVVPHAVRQDPVFQSRNQRINLIRKGMCGKIKRYV